MTEYPGHLSSHLERRVAPHHVAPAAGSRSSRHVFDALYRLIAGNKPLVSAKALGGFEFAGRRVYRHDGRRGGERSQKLDRHLAEASGTDHHGSGVSSEQVKRPFDGMITGERRVRQRSSFSGLKCSQRNQAARRWKDHGGRRPPVSPAKPAAAGGTAGVLAIILHAHPAVLAVPAAPGAVNNHRVSGRESHGTGAKLLDPPRVL